MSGALSCVNVTAAAEFNVNADPEAAQRVFTQAEVPVTMVPLDLTRRCPAGPEWLDALAAAGPRSARLAGVPELYRDTSRSHYGVDAVACAGGDRARHAAHHPDAGAGGVRLHRWRGAARWSTGGSAPWAPVQVALDADVDAVLAEILERVRRLG